MYICIICTPAARSPKLHEVKSVYGFLLATWNSVFGGLRVNFVAGSTPRRKLYAQWNSKFPSQWFLLKQLALLQ